MYSLKPEIQVRNTVQLIGKQLFEINQKWDTEFGKVFPK